MKYEEKIKFAVLLFRAEAPTRLQNRKKCKLSADTA